MPKASAEESRNGRIVTFYSYKGGTGRTMAMANVAWILASNGHRVLAADWDLESPGLHRFFSPFLDLPVPEAPGVIDLFRSYGKIAAEWKENREPYLLESSVPGVFVAGDVRHGSVKRVASAVGEGSIAVQFVHQYLAGF